MKELSQKKKKGNKNYTTKQNRQKNSKGKSLDNSYASRLYRANKPVHMEADQKAPRDFNKMKMTEYLICTRIFRKDLDNYQSS